MVLASLFAAMVVVGSNAEDSPQRWAVIAAGSKGFMNYRHQADACHAYQVMRKSGIPEANIILMMQDDVATAKGNPFPGQLFNKMGDNVPDVYQGCNVDYRGSHVTASLFAAVLTGNESGVTAGGKVLRSTSRDHVFVNFIDHGGVGIVAFPNGPFLHAKDLSTALKTMQKKQMFNELVFYMEACESGSMFPTLGSHDKIYAVTAANAKESSWGYYCMPKNDTVNGKHIGSCLGDLFSISWMEDADLGGAETLRQQLERVRNRTTKSHVEVFGDKTFADEDIGNFELGAAAPVARSPLPAADGNGALSVRDIGLQTAEQQWRSAGAEDRAEAWRNYQRIKDTRDADALLFSKIVQNACSGIGASCEKRALQVRMELGDLDCHYDLAMSVHQMCPRRAEHDAGGWNGYNMQFSQTLANLCEMRSVIRKTAEDLVRIVQLECRSASRASLGHLEASTFGGEQIIV